MRKLLTLVFLLSFALSAQAQFPSWGRQYRPFYGKMRFMDTVAFYGRGTARPDFLLQSIDSFGRMRWVDPDSLGISGGGGGGTTLYSGDGTASRRTVTIDSFLRFEVLSPDTLFLTAGLKAPSAFSAVPLPAGTKSFFHGGIVENLNLGTQGLTWPGPSGHQVMWELGLSKTLTASTTGANGVLQLNGFFSRNNGTPTANNANLGIVTNWRRGDDSTLVSHNILATTGALQLSASATPVGGTPNTAQLRFYMNPYDAFRGDTVLGELQSFLNNQRYRDGHVTGLSRLMEASMYWQDTVFGFGSTSGLYRFSDNGGAYFTDLLPRISEDASYLSVVVDTADGYWYLRTASSGGSFQTTTDYQESLLEGKMYLNSSTDSLTMPVFSNATSGGTHALRYLPGVNGAPGRLYACIRSNDGDGIAEAVRWNDPFNDLTDYDILTGTGATSPLEGGEELSYSKLQNKFFLVAGDATYARDQIAIYEFGPDDNSMTLLTEWDGNDGFTSGPAMWVYDDTANGKTYLYVFEGSYTPELHVFDYDAPASPVTTINISTDANSVGHSIIGDGEQLFMGHAFGAPGFFVRASMANPAVPVKTQGITIPGIYAFTDDLAIVGDYVFAASELSGAGTARLFRFNKYDLTDSISYPIGQASITGLYYDGEYIWIGSNDMSTDTVMARFEPESERLELFGAQNFPGVGSFNEITKVTDDAFFITSWNGASERGGIARFAVPKTNTEVIYFNSDATQYLLRPVGGLLYADSADVVAVNIAATGTLYDVAGLQVGPAAKVTSAATGFTIQKKGLYRVAFSGSGVGGANTLYEVALAQNGSRAANVGGSAYLFSGTASAPAAGSFNTILNLSAGDVLSLKIRNLTSTANWQFYSLAFTVEKL